MTTATAGESRTAERTTPQPSLVTDSLALAGRHLRMMSRRPASIVGALVLPVIFAVLFLTVFGRVMDRAGIDYAQFMVPAIVLQSVFFSGMSISIWAAEDATSGMIGRLRSMPIARMAPAMALLIGETIRTVIGSLVLIVVGYIAGFRFETGIVGFLGFVGLVVCATFAICLPYLVLGYGLGKTEPVQAIGNLVYFPLLLVSTLFVPAQAYPDWMRPIVENQPISRIGEALRAASTLGMENTTSTVLIALAWCAVLTAVFAAFVPRAFGKVG
ncbi:multidrug ABC transporter permease [Gordonia pseudamarae]|jgi:ABC-2 type transport system permease protein|uniref:Transport permease protein n=1 Tax=Gordonia pseudamarae TaxID=2831662 RepID=A0ABX6IGB4_9ACTN|nr:MULTISPECIES: ABC transporter permease [Gordonia]MBD0024111.1 ABC transporter permease [Gordonia sp. (in: high G+C Gram-positive bacteria)]QHN25966.1 multidrug ABC transporter permease [Gordonia pseudamarae]QHN34897.1 multidrug ABC transporter permease [Gordonia pseudamarae]